MNPTLMSLFGKATADPGMPTSAKIFLGILAAGTVVVTTGVVVGGVATTKIAKTWADAMNDASSDSNLNSDTFRTDLGEL